VARNGKSNPWNGHRPGASIRASEDRKADRVLERRRGVDHSAHSREAARFAAGLAERLGLRLVIAHALSATVLAFHPTWPGQASPDEDEGVSRTRHAGERLVSELVKSGGVRDTSGRVEIGLAPECLRAIAEEESAEFVVVGTKGAGAARLVLMGSVSLATVRIARCPVVVVPPAVRLDARVVPRPIDRVRRRSSGRRRARPRRCSTGARAPPHAAADTRRLDRGRRYGERCRGSDQRALDRAPRRPCR
jgi:nucleotide-binding universal stress UspA family protein